MSRVIDYETNIDKQYTRHVPVRYFMTKPMDVHSRVGGLLDYGYDTYQIATMCKITHKQVADIMQQMGYKTIDKMEVYYGPL